MAHAKVTPCDVILVTADRKEDWWLREDGRWTIGPRPELIEEFEAETQRRFYAYNAQEFLRHGAKLANVAVPPDAMKEVQAVEQANQERDALEKEKPRVPMKANPSAEGAYAAPKTTDLDSQESEETEN